MCRLGLTMPVLLHQACIKSRGRLPTERSYRKFFSQNSLTSHPPTRVPFAARSKPISERLVLWAIKPSCLEQAVSQAVTILLCDGTSAGEPPNHHLNNPPSGVNEWERQAPKKFQSPNAATRAA